MLSANRRGASLVEYVLVLGLVALAALLGFRAWRGAVGEVVFRQGQSVATLSAPGERAPGSASGTIDPSQTLRDEGARAPGKSISRRAWDFGTGFLSQAWGTVTDLGAALWSPRETLRGIGSTLRHPLRSAAAMKDAMVQAWNDNPDAFAGAVVFEVVTLPVGVLKASKATGVALASRVAARASEAADAGKLAKIEDAATAARRVGAEVGGESRGPRRLGAPTARLPGRVLLPDPGTVEARRELAVRFLMDGPAPLSPERAASHVRGIDLTKPVEVVELGPSDEVIQYAASGAAGKYFAPPGTPADVLGIDPAGRVLRVFRGPDGGARALRSTAADIESLVTADGTVIPGGKGGGIQYRVSTSDGFQPMDRQP